MKPGEGSTRFNRRKWLETVVLNKLFFIRLWCPSSEQKTLFHFLWFCHRWFETKGPMISVDVDWSLPFFWNHLNLWHGWKVFIWSEFIPDHINRNIFMSTQICREDRMMIKPSYLRMIPWNSLHCGLSLKQPL
jgi:hypothetical protein